MANPVFLITGPPGAGKTTTCKALLKRFPLGVHLEVDRLREAVVSGYASPIEPWTQETDRQFRLAREAICVAARLYADDGFSVAIDDVVFPHGLRETYRPALQGLDLRLAVLLPGEAEALRRNARRETKAFSPSVLEPTIRTLCAELATEWGEATPERVLDTSDWTVEGTVDAVLALDSG